MNPIEKDFLNVLSSLEYWANYENSSLLRDISKLEGIKHLLKKLDNPEKKFKIIHIAGTNGKGSIATILYNLQMKQGKTINIYRSPHLISFNESELLL